MPSRYDNNDFTNWVKGTGTTADYLGTGTDDAAWKDRALDDVFGHNEQSAAMQHMLDDNDLHMRFDENTYKNQASSGVVQQKQYSFFLWLPMLMPIKSANNVYSLNTTQDPSNPTGRENIIMYNRRLNFTDSEVMTAVSNNYRLVDTLKSGTKSGVHDLGLWIRRPLLESDKHHMSVAQMKITLLAHMIPAADVNGKTRKMEVWPWLQRLASGVLIEPRPEVMANPCKFFSQYQLQKYLRTFNTEQTADLTFWEMFATPSDMCTLYSELFKGSITDAAFSNALANKAYTSGHSAIKSAERLGQREAGLKGSKRKFTSTGSMLTQDEFDDVHRQDHFEGASRKFGGVNSAGKVAKSQRVRKLRGKS
jgi:hypothetical protein